MWRQCQFLLVVCSWTWILVHCRQQYQYLEDWQERDDGRPSSEDVYGDLDSAARTPDNRYIIEDESDFISPDLAQAEGPLGNPRRIKKNWLRKLWAKKEMSKRRLSPGEILQLLREATQLQGLGQAWGKLKGVRFGVSRKRTPPDVIQGLDSAKDDQERRRQQLLLLLLADV